MFGVNKEIYKIFKNAGSTYFYCSLIFPRQKRKDVFNLYAFLRTLDDLIDQEIPDKSEYFKMKNDYIKGESKNYLVQSFIDLEKKYSFKKEWINSFFNAIESDIEMTRIETLKELEAYIYGVTEIVGLFICRIMGLPEEAEKYALLQGRAMHYMNVLRDIGEDKNILNREYLPIQHQKLFGLADLDEAEVMKHREAFVKLIRYEIVQFRKYQAQAEKGYKYFSKRLVIPIRMSADICKWVIDKIEENPLQVYTHKVKPSKLIILKIFIRNIFSWN